MENEKQKMPNKDQQETISELADRHMFDEGHTTTDEEIRNAKVEIDTTQPDIEGSLYEVDNTTVIPPFPGETDESDNRHGGSTKDDDKTTPPNPYSVLGS